MFDIHDFNLRNIDTPEFPIWKFNPEKDKIHELPIYDRLDFLLMTLTSPGYKNKEVSFKEIASFVFGIDYDTSNKKEELNIEINLFIDKLIEDGFLKCNDNKYSATLKARITIETHKGYRCDVFIKDWERKANERFKQFQKDLQENQTRLIEEQTRIQQSVRKLTHWIAFGTVFASFLGTIALFQKNYIVVSIEVLTGLFVLLSGIGIGIIVCLLIPKVLLQKTQSKNTNPPENTC